MKANPISSGLVSLLFCLHCGAFSCSASFGIASAPVGFFCMCCHGEPACINDRTGCTMGECNCACMPVHNPFGRFGQSFSFCIPCILSVCFSSPSLVSLQAFPH